MEEAQRDSFLKDEYLLLQNQYEDYDKRSITIKGWVASGATVAIALGFNTSYRFSFLIPLAVAIIVISIWYLEAYWKLFQYALRLRIRVIEAHFRKDPDSIYPDPAPFQVYKWWFKGYRTYLPVTRMEKSLPDGGARPITAVVAFQAFVMVPYAPICLVCAISSYILFYNPPPTSSPASATPATECSGRSEAGGR